MKLITKTTKKMWDYLMEKIANGYVVSALLGISYSLSEFKTQYSETADVASGFQRFNYTRDIMSGKVPMEVFVHDGMGYGLCAWNKWTSKQGLYNMAKKEKKSIGSLDIQLAFIWDELHENEYAPLWMELRVNPCASVQDAVNLLANGYFKTRHIEIEEAVHYASEIFYEYSGEKKPKKRGSKKEKDEEPEKPKKVLVSRMNNVCVYVADNARAKIVGALDSSKRYEYVMSNESKRWHCIVFDGKLRWVSGMNTQVIDA